MNSYANVMNIIRSRTTSHVYKLYAHEYAVSDDNVYKPAWRASILATRNYVVTGSNMLPVKWLSTCANTKGQYVAPSPLPTPANLNTSFDIAKIITGLQGLQTLAGLAGFFSPPGTI